MSRIYNITEAADKLKRSVKTLQRWDRDGILTASRTKTNRRFYHEADLLSFLGIVPKKCDRKIVVYCRVSSQSQKPDLKNQRSILETFVSARGLANVEYIVEIGGGLNFKRKKFLKLIDSIIRGEVEILVLAHKDRLVRFGFELISYLCKIHNCEILLLNNEALSPEEEMVQDVMAILHCFSSRLYGLRNYKNNLKKVLK